MRSSGDEKSSPPPPPPPPSDGAAAAIRSVKEPPEACRRLLPAALFLLTFATVMMTLFIYMNHTALKQLQFRQSMRHEDELANVAQDDIALIEYVRQWVLNSAAQPFPPHAKHPPPPTPPPPMNPTGIESYVASHFEHKHNGIFVEFGAYGSEVDGVSRTEWLEKNLGWHGLVVTQNARDYFRLRARRRSPFTLTAQSCLSSSPHPKEITYQEGDFQDEFGVISVAIGSTGEEFSARVKCFPLYSFLLAIQKRHVDFLSISCNGCELPVFVYLPYHKVHITLIEIIGKQQDVLTQLLISRGYAVVTNEEYRTVYQYAKSQND